MGGPWAFLYAAEPGVMLDSYVGSEDEVRRLAKEAEAFGYAYLWSPAYGPDSFVRIKVAAFHVAQVVASYNPEWEEAA